MSWGRFLALIRATKVVPLSLKKAGLTAADAQFFKSIDLSSLYDILPRLQYVQALVAMVAELLTSNDARRGIAKASTSVTNNLQNISRSVSQTSVVYSWWDKVMERVLNNLFDLDDRKILVHIEEENLI